MSRLLALSDARRRSRDNLRRARPRRLLIVCYGNIYRSAFVAAYLKRRLGGGAEIRSCGFHPVVGRSSPASFVEMAARYDVSLESHRSSVIARDDVDWADVVVLMDRHNWWSLKQLGADETKLVWLGAFTDGDVEIRDPYGLDDREAASILKRMVGASEALGDAIERQLGRT